MYIQAAPISSPVSSEGGDEYGRVVRFMPTDTPLGRSMPEQIEDAGGGRTGLHRTFSTEQPIGSIAAIRR